MSEAICSTTRLRPVEQATKIFEEHGDFIRNIIRSKIGDEALAEDIFQDFFISLVSHPFDGEGEDLKRQIYRAVINDVVDAARRTKRYTDKLARYGKHVAHQQQFAKEDIDEIECGKLFEVISSHVSRAEADAITLRYKDDRCLSEVGKTMGINSRSVSKYISSGFKKVRTLMVKDSL